MKPHMRRAVAYIAARLILQDDFEAVYDYAADEHYRFAGMVDDSSVSIDDYNCSCHISGNNNGSKYKLFHFGESAHLALAIVGHKFKGFDFDSGSEFEGTLSGCTVQLYDSRDVQFYRFSV